MRVFINQWAKTLSLKNDCTKLIKHMYELKCPEDWMNHNTLSVLLLFSSIFFCEKF